MDASSLRSPAWYLPYLWTAVACGLAYTALLGLVVAEWAPLMSADRTVAHGLHRSAVDHPGWADANQALTDWVWDPATMRVLLLLVAALLVVRGDSMTAVIVLVATVIGWLVQGGMKLAVGRARPVWQDPVDMAQNGAFPSGHAMTAALACTLLLWLLWHRAAGARWLWAVAAVAVVSVLGVGFTRVYLGVHWLSDVLGGWLLGVALAALATAACVRWGAPGGDREARSSSRA
ncbi:phosphatase PAP2 family protein [Streptomyces sp. KR80]|uniref:phosphatase PAP2 family protein n=1 Tax=Streptomyces sp. KR80 TaxID=3457426 RepID=UPI003FD58576